LLDAILDLRVGYPVQRLFVRSFSSEIERLCSKSRRCSKANRHPGKCDSKGRDYFDFWKYSSKQKLQAQKRELKDKSHALDQEHESKVARLHIQEVELLSKKEEANVIIKDLEHKRNEAGTFDITI